SRSAPTLWEYIRRSVFPVRFHASTSGLRYYAAGASTDTSVRPLEQPHMIAPYWLGCNFVEAWQELHIFPDPAVQAGQNDVVNWDLRVDLLPHRAVADDVLGSGAVLHHSALGMPSHQ